MSSGDNTGEHGVAFVDDVYSDDDKLDDFEGQEGPPEWNRVDFATRTTSARREPLIRADHVPPRFQRGYDPTRKSLHEPLRPKPKVRNRPQTSNTVFLFTQSAKESPSKARVQSAGPNRTHDKPIRLHTELATPEGLAALLGRKPRPPTASPSSSSSRYRTGPPRGGRPRPHTAHFAGGRRTMRPSSSGTASTAAGTTTVLRGASGGLPRSATSLSHVVLPDDDDSEDEVVPMHQFMSKLHASDAAQYAAGSGALAARKRALAMKRAGQTDPLAAVTLQNQHRPPTGAHSVRGNNTTRGMRDVDINTLETVRLGTQRVDDPGAGIPMLAEIMRPNRPRARLYDDSTRKQVKRDDTYEGFLDSIIESGQDKATVIDRILTKPKRHLSSKKLRQQVAKTRAQQRERGWNDNTSRKDSYRPQTGTTREYDSLTDPYCSVVENPKLLRRLKKDGQLSADAHLHLKKRIQRKKRIDEPVVNEVMNRMAYKNERVAKVDATHPMGHRPVDWATPKLFENFNPAPFEGNDATQIRIACERVAAQLEDLWDLLDFPENVRRQFRNANMTEATVGTYASMLSHLTQLLLERDSIRGIVNLLTEREQLVEELDFVRDEIQLGNEVDQDIHDMEAALREYTKVIRQRILKWQDNHDWNSAFIYRGRDILAALPKPSAGTAAHAISIVSDAAVQEYEERLAYEKKIGILTSRGKGKGKKLKGKKKKAAKQKALADKAFNAGQHAISSHAEARAAHVAEQYADQAVAAAFLDEDGDGIDDRFQDRPFSRSLMLHMDAESGEYRSDSAMSGNDRDMSRIQPPSRLATPLSFSDDRSLATDITSPLSLSNDTDHYSPAYRGSSRLADRGDDDEFSPSARDRAIHAARLVINDIHQQALAMKRVPPK